MHSKDQILLAEERRMCPAPAPMASDGGARLQPPRAVQIPRAGVGEYRRVSLTHGLKFVSRL
jgi:hypothetical protein